MLPIYLPEEPDLDASDTPEFSDTNHIEPVSTKPQNPHGVQPTTSPNSSRSEHPDQPSIGWKNSLLRLKIVIHKDETQRISHHPPSGVQAYQKFLEFLFIQQEQEAMEQREQARRAAIVHANKKARERTRKRMQEQTLPQGEQIKMGSLAVNDSSIRV